MQKPQRILVATDFSDASVSALWVLCESCHSDGGSLPDADAGVLAGQWMPYLQAVLMDFRSGARVMIDDMAVSFEKLDEQDYKALVHYYASQQ